MCSLMSGFDRYDFNLGLFQCTLSGKQQLSVWHPFGGMLTTLFLVMLAFLFYSACRYYCGSRKNLRKAAGEAFVIAGGLSLLVVLVQKVCSSSTQIRRTYGNGDETCEWYRIARGSLLNAWFLQLLYFFLIFLAAYLVTVYAPKIPKKLAECKPLLVKVGVLLASIAVIVIGSVTVTPERMSQFNQDMDQEEMKQFVQELQVTSKKMQRNLRCLK